MQTPTSMPTVDHFARDLAAAEAAPMPTTNTTLRSHAARVVAMVDELVRREQDHPDLAPMTVEEAKASLALALPRGRGLGDTDALERLAAVLRASPTTAGSNFFNQCV